MTSDLPPDISGDAAPGPMIEITSALVLQPEPEGHEVRRASLRRAFLVLAEVESPSLAPLRRTSPVAGGVAITHLVPVDSITVDELRRRAPLRAGHVLTIATAAAEALVALHGAGLAHGAVGVETLVVSMDGSVVLVATGVAWGTLGSEVDEPSASGDIDALGNLMRELLGPGSAPAPLVMAALRASDPDQFMRPGAVALRGLLLRAGRADSLLELLGPTSPTALSVQDSLVSPGSAGFVASALAGDGPEMLGSHPRATRGGDRGSDHRIVASGTVVRLRPLVRSGLGTRPRERRRGGLGHTRRGPWVWSIAALMGVTTVVILVLATSRDGARADTATRGPSSGLVQSVGVSPAADTWGIPPRVDVADPLGLDRVPGGTSVDWIEVLNVADSGRLAAISAGSPAALDDFVEPAGAAWAADIALLERIRSSKATIEGGDLILEQIDPVRIAPTSVVLQVRDRRAAYRVVIGGVRTEVLPRAARWWTITLRRSDAWPDAKTRGAWRISEVTPLVRSSP